MGVVAARGTASRRGRYRASSAPRLPTGASIAIIFAITLHAWTSLPAVTAFDGQVQIDTSPRDDSEYVSVDMAVPDAVASKPDTYAYTFAAMPTDGHHHIAWFEPKAVAPKVHHMLLFGCAGGVSPNLHTRSGGMFSPGGGEPRGSVCADSPAEPFIFGWGKNAPPLNLPDRVGFEVGGEHGFKHLVLEVHYLDPQPTDANETSGLAVHLRKGRPNRAMSVVAFAQGFTLPPGQARVPVRNACTYTMARPLSAFAFRVHTHALGVEVYAERLAAGAWPKDDEDGTDGTPAAATTNADDPFPAVRLMARDPQLPQLFERIDDRKITIHPGDVIRVTCIFDTRNRTQVTRAGWSHGDEMCNLYMMVHAEEPAYLSCNGARGNGRTRMEIQHSPDSSQASAQPPDDPTTMTAHLVDAPAGAWPKSLGQIAGIVAEPDGRHAWAFHRGKRIWDGDSFDPATNVVKDLDSPIAENTIARIELATGKVVKSFGANEHYMPHAITLGPNGDVWVTDCGLHQVIRYNATDGARVAEFGNKLTPGQGSDGFCKPTQVTVAEDNSFWVSDGYCNERIARFDSSGTYVGEFTGPKGHENEKENEKESTSTPALSGFKVPHAIELDARDSTLYVADREHARITAHQLDGTHLRTYDLSPHGLVYGLSVLRSEERGVSGLYALCWKRDGGEVNMVWIPTEAGRASWSKTHHLTGKQVSWRLSSMTTPHAITTFGGAAGGTDAWGRGVNVLVSETRPTLGDVNLQRLWIGVDEVDEKEKEKDGLKLQVVPPRGWVEGGRTYVEEEALPGSEKSVAPTMEATKGKMEAETETEPANVDDKATEDTDDGDDGDNDDDGDDDGEEEEEEETVIAPQHGGGGGGLLPGGGVAKAGAGVSKHEAIRTGGARPVEVGDSNAAHSPLPLAFGVMIAAGATLFVFCLFKLPRSFLELRQALAGRVQGKQGTMGGRYRRLHDEV